MGDVRYSMLGRLAKLVALQDRQICATSGGLDAMVPACGPILAPM